jgi:hypothetical protein
VQLSRVLAVLCDEIAEARGTRRRAFWEEPMLLLSLWVIAAAQAIRVVRSSGRRGAQLGRLSSPLSSA